ncbi:MAG: hypothetical protein JXP34_09290 [Planctomycetes bacterium]|nr:hypothetical protein [Planctomycetota bacterium]
MNPSPRAPIWRRIWTGRAAAITGFLLLSPLSGLLAVLDSPRVGEGAFAIIMGAAAAIWCAFDSQERDIPYPRWLALGILLLHALFFPIHLVRSRGLRGLFLILPAVLVGLAGWLLALGAAEITERLSP